MNKARRNWLLLLVCTQLVVIYFVYKGELQNFSLPGGIYGILNMTRKSFWDDNLWSTCRKKSPLLKGRLKVQLPESLTMEEIIHRNPNVARGGHYAPPNCESRSKTAIIIPYRDREHHLKWFLYNLHPFLQRQQLNYTIYIIHQAGNYLFNRAKLMNVGFKEAMQDMEWDCLFFHDVDLIPEDDRNLYTCDTSPKHVSVAIDKFWYRLPYLDLFGGVSALTPEQYLKMNGYPNHYWGWGGEDDDVSARIRLSNMSISRPTFLYGRYKMIKHSHDEKGDNEQRFALFEKTPKTWKKSGINNIQYKLLSKELLPLYTNITVDIGTKESSDNNTMDNSTEESSSANNTMDNSTEESSDNITVDNSTEESSANNTMDNSTEESSDHITMDNSTEERSDNITVDNSTEESSDNITMDNSTVESSNDVTMHIRVVEGSDNITINTSTENSNNILRNIKTAVHSNNITMKISMVEGSNLNTSTENSNNIPKH